MIMGLFHGRLRLIPVKVEGMSTPKCTVQLPPLYDGDAAGRSSTHTQHAESERDEFGTIVNEVTVVTTRGRYQVDGA